MANFRALTIQGGRYTQIQDANMLEVGSGIDANVGQSLTIGNVNATAMTIGKVGIAIDQIGDWEQSIGTYLFDGGAWNVNAGAASTLDASGTITIGQINTTGIQIGRVGAITTQVGAWEHAVGSYSFTAAGWSVNGGAPASLDATTVTLGGTNATALNLGRVGGAIGFFGIAAQPKQSITGVLSLVADANAKAVLTSIIAALKSTATGYGLVNDTTT